MAIIQAWKRSFSVFIDFSYKDLMLLAEAKWPRYFSYFFHYVARIMLIYLFAASLIALFLKTFNLLNLKSGSEFATVLLSRIDILLTACALGIPLLVFSCYLSARYFFNAIAFIIRDSYEPRPLFSFIYSAEESLMLQRFSLFFLLMSCLFWQYCIFFSCLLYDLFLFDEENETQYGFFKLLKKSGYLFFYTLPSSLLFGIVITLALATISMVFVLPVGFAVALSPYLGLLVAVVLVYLGMKALAYLFLCLGMYRKLLYERLKQADEFRFIWDL